MPDIANKSTKVWVWQPQVRLGVCSSLSGDLTRRRATHLNAIPMFTTRGKQSYKVGLRLLDLEVLGAGKGQEEEVEEELGSVCLTQKGRGCGVCDQGRHLEKENLEPGLKDK